MPIDDIIVKSAIKETPNSINILMHGAIIRKKWYETWIQAINLLPDKYMLTIVGGIGPVDYLEELRQSIKDLKLETRVTIVSRFLPDTEYQKYIQDADIIVYPYLISTASAALAEWALKFEKPFLTSDLDSFIDYLGTQKYSFKVGDPESLAEKILQLDIEQASQFSLSLKEQYSWSKVWKKLLKIFITL